MNTVEVRGAYKFYGKPKDPKIVLSKLNMTVAPGSIYGLMGASGCGKTTLLSCIVGMIDLDGGDITVLGHRTKADEIQKAGPRIGYMPQETALIGELTIKETIYYFGKIFQINIDKLRDRYKMLKNLLELPRGDQRVEECSGGQQRRVSFAAAMIHEPDLLILDEPTVGLDPILREKIWDFMLHVTRTSKLAIIITTHYIDEAKQADRCGLMRNGILLAEDTPRNIISRHEVENLEEAFLKLCMKRGSSEEAIEERPTENNNHSDFELTQKPVVQAAPVADNPMDFVERKSFQWDTIKALLTKNFLQIKRQPAGVVFLLIVPIIQIVFFYWAIGGNPIGLRLGIVDHEIASYDDCLNSSLITTFVHDDTCDLHSVSCRFLTQLTDDIAIKVFYDSYEEAYEDAKKGNIIGIIEFAPNFTASLVDVHENRNQAEPGSRANRKIGITMDQTNQQLTFFLQRNLYNVYKNYSENMLGDCNLPRKLDNIPIDFLGPIYGEYEADFKQTMAPAMIMVMIFYIAVGLTVAIFIHDRKEGFWNRTLLAGVSTAEMMLAHSIIQSTILLMQVAEVIVLVGLVFGAESRGSFVAVIAMLALLGWSGMFFGLLLSCFVTDLMQASLVVMGISQPMMVLAGMFWPLEGMPLILRYLSYCMPFTLPAISVRNIMSKGYPLTDITVLTGFGVVLIWTAAGIILGLKALQMKKYSRNT